MSKLPAIIALPTGLLLALLTIRQVHAISYPDKRLTPGAAVTVDRAEVCSNDYLSHHQRHVSQALKHSVCATYGILTECSKNYVIDHFIPRELGGLDVAANLWPQPIAEARIKDKLENLLHKAVCAGRLSLVDAQACIIKDWYACWECWNSVHYQMGDEL